MAALTIYPRRGVGSYFVQSCSSCLEEKSPMVPNPDPKQYWDNRKNYVIVFCDQSGETLQAAPTQPFQDCFFFLVFVIAVLLRCWLCKKNDWITWYFRQRYSQWTLITSVFTFSPEIWFKRPIFFLPVRKCAHVFILLELTWQKQVNVLLLICIRKNVRLSNVQYLFKHLLYIFLMYNDTN